MGKFTKAFEKNFPQKNGTAEPASGRTGEAYTPSAESRRAVSGKNGADSLGIYSDSSWDERLKLSTEPYSQVFESFRRLRTSILHSGRKPRTILVTSVMPGEGKGFVCANLGIALSRDIEHQALILDCDFRRPNLTRFFGLANEAGLVDHLQDGVDLSMLIRDTGHPKLSLLPSGKPPKNPSELISSNRMISFIGEISNGCKDRIILFDSPPSSFASEVNVLAKHMDGVILVIRHGRARKEEVKKYADTIGPEKILGLVYNACPEDRIGAFMSKRYGYGYYYY